MTSLQRWPKPHRMSRPTIAAAVIVLNEERQLPGLLDRLRWVDEIVVLDGGSSDATAAIAARRGCRVEDHPFDNFAAQRNRALEHCTADWILSVDADERPTPALIAQIQLALDTPGFAAWRIPVHSTIFGRRVRFSGTQHDNPIRLLRRGCGHWHAAVHEQLRVAGPVGQLSAALEHHTIPNFQVFRRKMDQYTALEAAARLASRRAPRGHEQWWRPVREVARRLIWNYGLLDGPPGWAFCALSGWSEWVLARRHRTLWHMREPA